MDIKEKTNAKKWFKRLLKEFSNVSKDIPSNGISISSNAKNVTKRVNIKGILGYDFEIIDDVFKNVFRELI